MPKLLDHDERRLEIARAVWRLVRDRGLASVSVRSVAAEAGLATASLRRAFPTQQALLTFCFELVVERAGRRIADLPAKGDARAYAEQVLREVLPLDAERRAEMTVWLVFASAALTDASLAPVFTAGHDALHELCRAVVASLGVDEAAVPFEAEGLHALVDGLAMHLVTSADRTSVERAETVLARQLDDLVRAGTGHS